LTEAIKFSNLNDIIPCDECPNCTAVVSYRTAQRHVLSHRGLSMCLLASSNTLSSK